VREDKVIYMSPGDGWTDYASVPLTSTSKFALAVLLDVFMACQRHSNVTDSGKTVEIAFRRA
jgi:hypothetical protein